MSKLRVLVQFRDMRNFFTVHQPGDIIEVNDQERVTRLIEGEICEEVISVPNAENSDSSELGNDTPAVVEKPKRTRKKKEA